MKKCAVRSPAIGVASNVHQAPPRWSRRAGSRRRARAAATSTATTTTASTAVMSCGSRVGSAVGANIDASSRPHVSASHCAVPAPPISLRMAI